MEQLTLGEFMRRLTKKEKDLIKKLILEIDSFDLIEDLETVFVEKMNDGNMGGFTFINNNQSEKVLFKLNEISFKDKDDVTVVASLFTDKSGRLAELDIWKTDFSPLKEIPTLN